MRAILLLALTWGVSAQSIPASPAQTPKTVADTPAQQWSWFAEARAAAGNNLAGGLGIAMDAGSNQQAFGEIQLQTGKLPAGQASSLLIGDKSNYPAVTVKGRKLTPFSLVAFGASINSLKTVKFAPPAAGLSASSISQFATGAGFAEQYGAGFETDLNGWKVGVGFSVDKTGMGWREYPFLFMARSFGK